MKIENRISKQTHVIKLAESLSPITEKLEVNKTSKKLGGVLEKSQPEIFTPQPAIEHTPPSQPVANKEGVIYDTELENKLNNNKTNTDSFQTYEDLEHGCMWNGFPVKILRGTEVEIIKNFLKERQVFTKY